MSELWSLNQHPEPSPATEHSRDPVRTVRPAALEGTLEAAEDALLVCLYRPVAQESHSRNQAGSRS